MTGSREQGSPDGQFFVAWSLSNQTNFGKQRLGIHQATQAFIERGELQTRLRGTGMTTQEIVQAALSAVDPLDLNQRRSEIHLEVLAKMLPAITAGQQSSGSVVFGAGMAGKRPIDTRFR